MHIICNEKVIYFISHEAYILHHICKVLRKKQVFAACHSDYGKKEMWSIRMFELNKDFFLKNQCSGYEYRWLVSLSYNRLPNFFVACWCSNPRPSFIICKLIILTNFIRARLEKLPFLCVNFSFLNLVKYLSGVTAYSKFIKKLFRCFWNLICIRFVIVLILKTDLISGVDFPEQWLMLLCLSCLTSLCRFWTNSEKEMQTK